MIMKSGSTYAFQRLAEESDRAEAMERMPVVATPRASPCVQAVTGGQQRTKSQQSDQRRILVPQTVDQLASVVRVGM
jgi:hypothetical protein